MESKFTCRSAVRSSAWLGLFCKNWIIAPELKSLWEQHLISSTLLNFLAILLRDFEIRIIQEISDALLDLWRLPIEDFKIYVCHFAEIQEGAIDYLSVGPRICVKCLENKRELEEAR